ncbi:DedA family protein [Agilicoccus flavus]|uniref:DedA family protein n=1 Tax=Agilicoccus flavus TaxID=2775968 RepID=UPI001CF6D2BB|nr:VTT domain-containing protein [Agilicoccus flavus]
MTPPTIDWLDPQYLLGRFGTGFFWVSTAIVFIECGLLFPLLPGDSLLFAVGMFVRRGDVSLDIVTACVLLSVGAFLGNIVGYEIGRALGTPLYSRDGRFLKRTYFDQTNAFFDKHGNKALVLGRFVPIVRTFVTVVAGVGRMDRRRFFTWSAVGAVLWATGVTLIGYFLGGIAFIHDHLESAILAIVLVSVLPMVVEFLLHRRRTRAIVAETVTAGHDIIESHAHED